MTATARCQGLWDLFDLDDPVPMSVLTGIIDMCLECPILSGCMEETRRRPPTHTCVMGGAVWKEGRYIPPSEWRQVSLSPTRREKSGAGVVRVCAAPGCQERFVTMSKINKYCSRRCCSAGRRRAGHETARRRNVR